MISEFYFFWMNYSFKYVKVLLGGYKSEHELIKRRRGAESERREEEKGERETGRRGRGEELLKQAELSAASLLLS